MASKTNVFKTTSRSRFTIGTAINIIILLFLVFVCTYPFLNVISYSFSGYNAVLSRRVTFYPIDFTLDAFKSILSRRQLWDSMRTTVTVTVVGTALSMVCTVIAAYVLSRRHLPGRRIFTTIILITMYFSGGMIPTFLVVRSLGMYNTLFALFVPAAINVFNFIVMRTFFMGIPQSLEEAARIDGASDIRILFHIILPLSTSVLATIALFYAVDYWNNYFDALLYISDASKYTLQLRLRSIIFGDELNNSGVSEGGGTQVMTQSLKMATVIMSTVPILLVYPWLQKYFVKGVMLGSLKG